MRIAAAQIVTGANPEDNLALVDEWTRAAADEGAEMVVFPEAVQRAFGYPLGEVAEDLGGSWSQQLRSIAQRYGMVVVAGMFTHGTPAGDAAGAAGASKTQGASEAQAADAPSGGARVRNTLLAAGPSVFASYDKVHLYDAFGFQESRTVEPGERLVQFDCGGLSFGLATCYDIRFPQLFQAHARAGTHATLVPASWAAGPGKVEQWRTLAVARALDSTQYVIACGQGVPSAAGVQAPENAPSGVGHSIIVSPTGEILAQAGEEPELLIADLDHQTVEKAREVLPVLANARTDLGW